MALSLRQFDLLHERTLNLRWQQQWQLGAVASAVYRSGMREFDPMPRPEDFVFTSVRGKKHSKPAKRKKLSQKVRLAAMRAMLRASASKVVNAGFH